MGRLLKVKTQLGRTEEYSFTRYSYAPSQDKHGTPVTVPATRQYRAWGAVQAETYGSGYTATTGFNARLQVNDYTLTKPNTQIALQYTHEYYADGQPAFSHNAL